MSEGYTVWLPFSLPNEQVIDVAEAPRRGTLSGFQAMLLRTAACYVLEVSGIPSLDDARAFLKRLETGLLWAATMSRFGVRLSNAAPRHIDGHGRVRCDTPAIYKGARPALGGRTRGTLSGLRQPEPFLEWISEGAALPCSEGLAGDAKLALALDLYCMSHFEATPAARFVTLFTALEAVAPSKKGGSHTKRITTYVRDTLRAEGDPEADATADEVKRLYSVRGDLIHGDGPRLGDEPDRLDRIMAKVLRAALHQKGR